MVIEDNISSIHAAREAGIKQAVWVNRPSEWHHYREGVLPGDVASVTSLLGLVQLLGL